MRPSTFSSSILVIGVGEAAATRAIVVVVVASVVGVVEGVAVIVVGVAVGDVVDAVVGIEPWMASRARTRSPYCSSNSVAFATVTVQAGVDCFANQTFNTPSDTRTGGRHSSSALRNVQAWAPWGCSRRTKSPYCVSNCAAVRRVDMPL